MSHESWRNGSGWIFWHWTGFRWKHTSMGNWVSVDHWLRNRQYAFVCCTSLPLHFSSVLRMRSFSKVGFISWALACQRGESSSATVKYKHVTIIGKAVQFSFIVIDLRLRVATGQVLGSEGRQRGPSEGGWSTWSSGGRLPCSPPVQCAWLLKEILFIEHEHWATLLCVIISPL